METYIDGLMHFEYASLQHASTISAYNCKRDNWLCNTDERILVSHKSFNNQSYGLNLNTNLVFIVMTGDFKKFPSNGISIIEGTQASRDPIVSVVKLNSTRMTTSDIKELKNTNYPVKAFFSMIIGIINGSNYGRYRATRDQLSKRKRVDERILKQPETWTFVVNRYCNLLEIKKYQFNRTKTIEKFFSKPLFYLEKGNEIHFDELMYQLKTRPYRCLSSLNTDWGTSSMNYDWEPLLRRVDFIEENFQLTHPKDDPWYKGLLCPGILLLSFIFLYALVRLGLEMKRRIKL